MALPKPPRSIRLSPWTSYGTADRNILAGPEEGGGVGLEVFLNLYGSASTTVATNDSLDRVANPATVGQTVTADRDGARPVGAEYPPASGDLLRRNDQPGNRHASPRSATYSTSSWL